MKNPLDRGDLRFFLVLLGVLAGQAGGWSVLYGTPLLLLGILLHVWSKGCLEQDRTVTQSGPYRFVRHPFYLANALIDTGVVVMSGWWVLMVLFPLWWLVVYIRVMRSEERYLMSLYPEAYGAYRKRVPMLIPYRRPLPSNGGGFSWTNHNIAHGREVSRSLRILAYPVLFLAAHLMWPHPLVSFAGFQATVRPTWPEPLAFVRDDQALGLCLLGGLTVLYGLAWMFKRHLKDGRRIVPTAFANGWFRKGAALALLAAAVSVTYYELESDGPMFAAGGLLLASSVAVYLVLAPPQRALLAEGLALVAAAVMCELPWLAALPILYYAGVVLDARLAAGPSAAWRHPVGVPVRFFHPAFYHLLVLVGLTVALAKELVIDGLLGR
jgi:hypothetical protein